MIRPPSLASIALLQAYLHNNLPEYHFVELGGGRNSRVYRIDIPDRSSLVIKEYSPDFALRRSLEHEVKAYDFLNSHGVFQVPQALLHDFENGIAIYSYIPGNRFSPLGKGGGICEPFVEFVAILQSLPSHEFPLWAKDALRSPAHFFSKIQERIQQLQATALKPVGDCPQEHARLQHWISNKFLRALDLFWGKVQTTWTQQGLSLNEDLPMDARILSPSDFGFHNALWDGTTYRFLDFEFFGQDDPVKLVADFLLHPAMALNTGQARYFLASIQRLFAKDSLFTIRLHTTFSLMGLHWCCILLNEFNACDYSRRSHATDQLDHRQCILNRQLEKADILLDYLLHSHQNAHFLSEDHFEASPYAPA